MKFTSEERALKILELGGFIIDRGIIKAPKHRKDESDVSVSEAEAITYLCEECDYSTP